MASDKWLEIRIAEITKLKSPTDAQNLLVALHAAQRDESQEKIYAALVKAEKATYRAQKAIAQANRLTSESKEKERKARAHRLIKLGLAFDRAGIGDWSHEEAVGLLQIMKGKDWLNSNNRERARDAGEKFIATIQQPATAPEEQEEP